MSIPERAASPASVRTPSYGTRRTTPRLLAPQDLDATLPLLPQEMRHAPEQLGMKCLYCQAPIARGATPVEVDRNGYRLAWHSVPAWVCSRCGQAYFERPEVDMVRTAVTTMSRLTPGHKA
jgi:YgiT-type zinc finger domain-containing protein